MIELLPSTARQRLVATVLAAVLLSLAFPNSSVLALLPVALVPLMAATDGASPRRAAFLGIVFGIVFWIATIPWIAYTVHRYGEVSWPVGVLALVATALILCGPFLVPPLAVALVRPASVPGFAATWAAAWVVQEGIRIHLFGGFPWALVSYPLADHPVLTQSAALGGALFTSFLVVFVNGLLFAALTRPRLGERLGWLSASGLLILGAALLGAARIHAVRAREGAPWLTVSVVQPNVQQELRWKPGERERIWRDLVLATRLVVGQGGAKPDLVLWPESASPYHWPWAPAYRDEVVALCRDLDVAILLGTVWTDRPADDAAPFYNAALLVTRDGPVLPPYEKVRLVPFGEYVPFASILTKLGPISRAVPGSFTPGAAPRPIPFRGGSLGGAVCYEVVYPWVLREQVRAGATLLFTLTNDAWYGTAGARLQHWQAAVFRSVETGRPLVRAAVTGISGFVTSAGEPFPLVGPDEKGGFTLPVAAPGPPAPAVRLGEAPLAVCAIALVAGILARRGFPPRKLGAA